MWLTTRLDPVDSADRLRLWRRRYICCVRQRPQLSGHIEAKAHQDDPLVSGSRPGGPVGEIHRRRRSAFSLTRSACLVCFSATLGWSRFNASGVYSCISAAVRDWCANSNHDTRQSMLSAKRPDRCAHTASMRTEEFAAAAPVHTDIGAASVSLRVE